MVSLRCILTKKAGRVRHVFEIVFQFAWISSRLHSALSLLVAADRDLTEIISSEQCMQRVSYIVEGVS